MAGTVTSVPSAIRPSELAAEEEHPCSDGKVLMETEPHANSIVAMRNQLQWHFEGVREAYVAGSMAVYYRQGDRSAVVAPDVFGVLGVEKGVRKSYRIWDEGGVVPAFVVEVASLSTSRRDATSKCQTYERMGVREYLRFDPVGKQIRQGLEGWRLVPTGYERVRETGSAGWGWTCAQRGGCCDFGTTGWGGTSCPMRKLAGRCRSPTGSAMTLCESATMLCGSATRQIVGSAN